ncbi:MAG: hypothetical protein HC901_03315 [Bdellovibrionaceae bacterium]|nr:hypothetical protein [Pseudobdellovibrionaceae bacterium]
MNKKSFAILATLFLPLVTLCASPYPEILKDINALSAAGSSSPSNMVRIGSTVYFTASVDYGQELWKTDGTAAGTAMVKDILPGTASSSISNLTAVDGVLFFSANDGMNGTELWKSDGTTAGTVLVQDIYSGSSSSSPTSLTNVNGTIYFRAFDPTNGTELWKSDGTSAGTVLVKDIYPGSSSSSPNSLTDVNGTLFFRATDGVNGSELWKSDGTSAGTVKLADPNFLSPTPNGTQLPWETGFFAGNACCHWKRAFLP